ncbi:MAG: M20 family metallopeptidase [Armatimonadetes bacterium]|nr:M20 family metallopeptidase [Armatimonadota bacterium]
MDEVVKLLRELVAIPSVNPCGKDVSGPLYLETQVGNYVEEFLRKIGVDVERQEVHPGRDNLLGRVRGKSKEKHFLLEAHTDTMPGDNMEFDPFQPFIKERRLYGRGSCDTKGSLAAMMTALKRIVETGVPEHSITLLASVDEEYQFTGVSHFIAREPLGNPGDLTAAIVGEPTARQIVIAHKGCVRWVLRTHGIAAHSSNPTNGVNALYRMAKVLNALERFNLVELPDRYTAHPLLGGATLSVGTIQGGQVVNVVPDLCEIQIDRRLLPGEEIEHALTEIEAYLKQQPEIDFEVEMVPPYLRDEAMGTAPEEEVVKRFEAACSSVYGFAEVRGVPFGTDASKISRKGIPSVVFGPGDIKLAHTSHEYVPLDELHEAVEVLVKVVEN